MTSPGEIEGKLGTEIRPQIGRLQADLRHYHDDLLEVARAGTAAELARAADLLAVVDLALMKAYYDLHGEHCD